MLESFATFLVLFGMFMPMNTEIPSPPSEYYIDPESPIEYNLDATERKYLARLLVAEVRGLREPYRTEAAMAVLDTVFLRTKYGLMSDGSITSTLLWHTSPNGPWQFPPWVVLGCNYVPEASCLDQWRLDEYNVMVDLYLQGYRGRCTGYPYYHSIIGWPNECEITDGVQFIEWHNGWENSVRIEFPEQTEQDEHPNDQVNHARNSSIPVEHERVSVNSYEKV